MNEISKKRSNENLPGGLAILVSGAVIFTSVTFYDWHVNFHGIGVPDWLVLVCAAGLFVSGALFLFRKEDACSLCGSAFRTVYRYYPAAQASSLRDFASQQNVTALLNVKSVPYSSDASFLRVDFGSCKKCCEIACVDSRLEGSKSEGKAQRQVFHGNAAKQLGAFIIENEEDD